MPFSELSHYRIDPAARDAIPLDYCLEHLVVPLGVPGQYGFRVGLLDPTDDEVLSELKTLLDQPFEPVQLNAYEIRKAVARLHGLPVGQYGIAVQLSASRELDFSEGRTAPQLIDDLLSVAIQQGATDVHLEVYAEDVDLRFRVDGRMRQVTTPLSPDNLPRVVSRLKVLCDVDVLDHRHPQDGHFGAIYVDGDERRRIDFRVSFAPAPHGEEAVIRVLDPRRFRLDLDELGMPEPVLERYRRLIERPDGLVLCVGPTASGKTNTLYATIAALREHEFKIVTCEEPIEYEFEKVNQREVNQEVGFAAWVRAFLRHNPDVLLVGEIRDGATAETVVQAATTGHLVLSTLHTRSAVSAVVRLRTLGIPDDQLAHTLVGILGQRLLARNCSACLTDDVPSAALVAEFFSSPPEGEFKRGAGCDACHGTGYAGLIGLFELLEVRRELAAAIGAGLPGDELLRVALTQGYQPVLDQALSAALRGETTLAEVARRVEPPELATG